MRFINITGNRTSNCGLPLIEGNGDYTTEERPVASFTRIQLQGSVNITFTQSDTLSMAVMADSNLVDMVKTTVHGETLTVSMECSYCTHNPIVVACSAPRFTQAMLAGSGSIELNSIAERNILISIQGSGDMEISGAVENLQASVMGSGSIDADDLTAQHGDITLMGSGDIRALCTQSVSAMCTGSGSIKVRGNPVKRSESVSGSGRIGIK